MLSDKRFLTVALIFCFVAIDLNAQDKLERFYATPAFGKAKEVWTQRLDPSSFFPVEERRFLLEDNISPRIYSVAPNTVINQVGLRVSRPMYANAETFWQSLRNDLAKELNKPKSAESLRKILCTQKASVDKKFQTKQETVCFFLELAEHQSVVRGKQEVWLLIEIELLPSKYDIYANHLLRSHRTTMEPLIPVPIHPEDEERKYELENGDLKPLVANRPVVLSPLASELEPLQDDDLPPAEREAKHSFVVNDYQKVQTYQIEAISYLKDELSPDAPFESYVRELHYRLPPGRVVTYEELHKILGDFAARQQNFFESYTGEKAIIGFEIRPYKHGKMTYTRIVYNPLAK